jgi:hypothetical protein
MGRFAFYPGLWIRLRIIESGGHGWTAAGRKGLRRMATSGRYRALEQAGLLHPAPEAVVGEPFRSRHRSSVPGSCQRSQKASCPEAPVGAWRY